MKIKHLLLPALAFSCFHLHAERIAQVPPASGSGGTAVPNTTSEPAGNTPESSIAANDLLQFENADSMHGRLISIDPTKGLQWMHPEADSPVDFSLSHILQVRLIGPSPKTNPPINNSLIRLTNRDELEGNVVALDENKLELDTWYAGKVTIPRKMIRSICPLKNAGSGIYEGPTGMEGWKLGSGYGGRRVGGAIRGNWAFKDNAFFSSQQGSIGRDLKLPASFKFEFDYAWKGEPQLMLALNTDNPENINSDCYQIVIQRGYFYINRNNPQTGAAQVLQANTPNMQNKNNFRFSICINRETSAMAIYMDGVLIQQGKDPSSALPKGTCAILYNQNNMPIKISNISVSSWDGSLDSSGTSSSGNSKGGDLVRLHNSDRVSGTVKNIKDGKLLFDASYAVLPIELSGVISIDFSESQTEQPKKNAGDVEVLFKERGKLTFQLIKWKDQEVEGQSQNFGKIKLNPNALRQVRFNLDKEGVDVDEWSSALLNREPGNEAPNPLLNQINLMRMNMNALLPAGANQNIEKLLKD